MNQGKVLGVKNMHLTQRNNWRNLTMLSSLKWKLLPVVLKCVVNGKKKHKFWKLSGILCLCLPRITVISMCHHAQIFTWVPKLHILMLAEQEFCHWSIWTTFPVPFFAFLWQPLIMLLRLVWNTLYSSGWPQTSNHPISVTLLLSIAITNMQYYLFPNLFKIEFFNMFACLLACLFFNAEDQDQCQVHAKQSFYYQDKPSLKL